MTEIENRIARIRSAVTRLLPGPAPEGDHCIDGEPTIEAIGRETGLVGVTREEITAAIKPRGRFPAVRVK